MNNKIGRKITSLTLMTIMFAGGFTFAIPGAMPAAHAQSNANLFVSAENSQFDNYMAGPMVIEVTVIDPDISDTDQGKGEPDVKVNGNTLRMAQATDGNWYGYFADKTQALIADTTQPFSGTDGKGLNFGVGCTSATGAVIAGVTLSETVGVFLNRDDGATGDTPGVLAACTAGPIANNAPPLQHVVRENKTLNKFPAGCVGGACTVPEGQIGIAVNTWPFIQLYNLVPTGDVVVQYNRGGGVQSTTLTFDTVDQFAGLELDRTKYPLSSQIMLTMTDLQLNIDPTDEDSWTWGANASNSTTFYQLYDENGLVDADGTTGAVNIQPFQVGMMFEDNGIFLLNPDAQDETLFNDGTFVATIVDNDDSNVTPLRSQNPLVVGSGAGSIRANDFPMTFTELAPITGILSNYDNSNQANLIITNNATRGTSATADYNETPQSIVVGFDYASIDIQPIDDEWNSGEEIPLTLVDGDANLNTRVDEDLDLFNTADVPLIPSLATGDPFTLGENGNTLVNVVTNSTRVLVAGLNPAGGLNPGSWGQPQQQAIWTAGNPTGGNASASTFVQAFSNRDVLAFNQTTGNHATGPIGTVVVDFATTAGELYNSISDPRSAGTTGPSDPTRFHGINMLNFDIRGINTTSAQDVVNTIITGYDVYMVNSTDTGITTTNLTPFILPADGGDGNTGALGAQGNWSAFVLAADVSPQSLVNLNDTGIDGIGLPGDGTTSLQRTSNLFGLGANDAIGMIFVVNSTLGTQGPTLATTETGIVIDFFSFGFNGNGVQDSLRVSSQIIRIEVEETGDNTSTFEGSLEYRSVNQLNILDQNLYESLSPIADDPTFIQIEDLTDEDSPRANYADLAGDGTILPVADQEEAPTHSGVVSFDLSSYKIADTVVITVEDQDLNTDSDLIDIFTVVRDATSAKDVAFGTVGKAGLPLFPKTQELINLGVLLDVTFDDQRWKTQALQDTAPSTAGADCNALLLGVTTDTGLDAVSFSLIETGPATGLFVGDFAVPGAICQSGQSTPVSTTGLDIETNYLDFRDASGEIIEVGDSAGIRANTGSVSLDRTVYPIPWGVPDFFAPSTSTFPAGRSLFPVHQTGIATDTSVPTKLDPGEFLANGELVIHIRVNDPDFDLSPDGEDVIAQSTQSGIDAGVEVGPVRTSIIRGSDSIILGYAGGPTSNQGVIDVVPLSADAAHQAGVRQFGPMTEVAPDAGIFEQDLTILYTDGPSTTSCPTTLNFVPANGSSFSSTLSTGGASNPGMRFDNATGSSANFCIRQGDIIQVQYTDPTDSSGDINTVTDSAAFDLRNGVLQSDKSVYIIGADAILTLIEPDFDLDNDSAETFDLDLIEWDSDAATVTMGNLGGATNQAAFDPEPANFRETGDSTGIFQIVIEFPKELSSDRIERGEEVILEYTDWGPAGSNFVGEEDEDINLTIFSSNFGATVELDQKVYSWTDKVYVTIVAPDHNFDADLIDKIGQSNQDPVRVSTRSKSLQQYKLSETGTDTGIFTGEVILTGFCHDSDGKSDTGSLGIPGGCPAGSDSNPRTGNAAGVNSQGLGPVDGFLETSDDDGLTVSFEFSEDETVVGSSLVRWNIGETQWLEASYPAGGTGVVRIVDPDMNLDPEAVDNFDVDVWSDSDAGGIALTVTETNEATGIFEGTVFFTTTDESSGHRLRVAEGDTITAEYEDNTLPDPYTRSDELDITGTSVIGTIVPPLERAPARSARVVDAFGNSLAEVSVDQQVQIAADLANGQNRDQSFAYLVQIQDSNGVTVSLAWITGSLSPGQSFSPALSWIPTSSGAYTATVFVWESVDNPTALSPPVSVTINVV